MVPKRFAAQDDTKRNAPDSQRQALVPDGGWKAWVLPGVLVGFVVLATTRPQSAAFCFVPLLGQLSVMSVFVYRSSQTARDVRYQTPTKNVLRAVVGSIFLGAAEVVTVRAVWECLFKFDRLESVADLFACVLGAVALASTRVLFTYAACAVSDYMFHRFVWHAHWTQGTTSVVFRSVWRQYVQHYLGHHRHVHDPETSAKMSKLDEKPMSDARKLAIEHASSKSLDDQHVLWCSNHGLTVGIEGDERVNVRMKWGCRLHTATMFLAMPGGSLAIISAIYGSLFGTMLHCTSSALTLYLTFHHDKYHCNAAERRQWAASRYDPSRGRLVDRLVGSTGSALWLCGGMDQVTSEHKMHHLRPEHREEYYGLVPYGRFFVYLFWQSW